MEFLTVWLTGIYRPGKAFRYMRGRPAPLWGFTAVLIRFIGTALLVTLPLALLKRAPFEPSYLTFLPTETYYQVWIYVLPIFGLLVWLLIASVAQVTLRLTNHELNFDQVANVLGMAMLIPIPFVWIWDVTMILTGGYRLEVMAVSHTVFQVWETVLGVVGFRRVLGLGRTASVITAILVNIFYILMGALFAR